MNNFSRQNDNENEPLKVPEKRLQNLDFKALNIPHKTNRNEISEMKNALKK